MYSIREGMPPDLVVPGDDLEVAGLLLDVLKSSLYVTDSGINLRACVKYHPPYELPVPTSTMNS